MKPTRFGLILGLILLVVIFALAANRSSERSLTPPHCQSENVAAIKACSALTTSYREKITSEDPLLPTYMSPFWVFTSYVEIAWGFLLSILLLLSFSIAGRLLKALPRLDRALTRPFNLQKRSRLVALCCSLSCAAAYLYYRYFYGFVLLGHALPLASFVPYQYQALPTVGLLCVGFLGMVAFMASRGTLAAIRWSLKVSVLPMALLLTLGLWLGGSTEMVLYVTKFAYWSFGSIDYANGWDGLYLLSNWTVLAISASLFTAFVLEDLRITHSAGTG